MKLQNVAKNFKTNAQFTSEEFSIGDASIVMSILRDKLYKNKIQVLVQEYISNARDAMREADAQGQIEITSPTTFNPVFKVRDYGLGISPDRMSNVFVKYASSTKRDDNKQTGGFGIGAKSAWSYTDSFTIVTYIDGVQRNYVAHIGTNNHGRLDYLGECETDQVNGTEIQVPVNPKDVSEFRKAILRTTHLWSESETPKIHGVSPNDFRERVTGTMYDNLEVTDYAKVPDFILGRYNEASVLLSVDGIPYPINQDLAGRIEALKALRSLVKGVMIIHLNTGDINIAANREDIENTQSNIDALTTIARKLHKTVDSVIKSEFNTAKNTFQHLAVYMSLKDQFNMAKYQQCGAFKVDDNGTIESDLFSLSGMTVVAMNHVKGTLDKDDLNTSSSRRRRWNNRARLNGGQFKHLFFTDGTESAVQMNHRLREYLRTNPVAVIFQARKAVAPKDGETVGPDQKTLDKAFQTIKSDLSLRDLKTISFVKPPKAERERIVREKQTFCVHNLASYRRDTLHLTCDSNDEKWLYVEMDGNTIKGKEELKDLAEYLEATTDYKVCAISKSTVKMISEDSNFTPLFAYLKTYKVTKDNIASLKAEAAKNREMIDKLKKVSGIKQKFLNQMIKEYESHSYKGGFVPKMLKGAIGKVDEVEEFKADDSKLSDELKNRYPLLKQLYWHGKVEQEEVAYYINAK
jgi:Histidine kinase-, DNA gyrase B-, and HSP90-like ATPase